MVEIESSGVESGSEEGSFVGRELDDGGGVVS